MSIADRADMAQSIQHRSYDLESVEFRDAATAGGDFTFEGVASVVDRPYEVNDAFGTFTETIRAGAFNKAIKDYSRKAADDVFLYVNHRHSDVPMASRNAGTLKLSADPNLRAVASLDPVRPDVIIARSAVQRGEMSQMSVGFTVNKGRDEWSPDYTERQIHEVNLREVSIVPIGANPFTTASMRSFEEFMDTITTVDVTPAQIERAYLYFADLRSAEDDTPPEIDPAIVERDRADRDRLDRKVADRPQVTGAYGRIIRP